MRFTGSSGSAACRRSVRTASEARIPCGSGSFAFPAPRSSLPVTRLDPRGFPPEIRLPRSTLRSRSEGPALVGFAPLPIGVRHRCLPRSIGPGQWLFPTTSPGIRRAVRPVPLHRRHRQRPLSTVSPPLRRWAAAHLALRPRRFARPRRYSSDHSRACCIPLPILGFDAFPLALGWLPAPSIPSLLTAWSPVTSSGGFPASSFVPPGGLPSLAAVPCHHGRCPPGLRSSPDHPPSRRCRCQLRRCGRCRRARCPSGLCSARESVLPSAAFATPASLSSLGLVPLRGCLLAWTATVAFLALPPDGWVRFVPCRSSSRKWRSGLAFVAGWVPRPRIGR